MSIAPSKNAARIRPCLPNSPLVLRMFGALLIGVTGCSCIGRGLTNTAPARNVAYNPFVSSASIHSNPRGDSGVAYRPMGPRSITTTRTEYKETVILER